MIQNTNNVYSDVVEIIQQYVPGTESIESGTRLFHDLLLMGDDAEEILLAIHKKYGVDFSSFKWKEYFPSEYAAPFVSILMSLNLYRMDQKKPITVNDIVVAINERKWSK